jgi:hypothetical protein
MKRRLHSSYQSSVDNSIPETVERERERSRIRSNGIPSQLLPLHNVWEVVTRGQTFRILSAGASNQWFIKLQMQLQLGPAVMDSLDKPKWNLLSRDSH